VAGENRSLPPVKRVGVWRRTASICALILVLLFALIYVARTFVFARLAEIYLLARGVPSSIAISRLDWNGMDASARLGARRTPDLAIGEIHAVFNGNWIPHLDSLTLSHTTLRVAFDGEKLSFGTLQRLVDSLTAPATRISPFPTRTSPSPNALHIVLKDARLLAFTPAGVVTAAGEGSLTGTRIDRIAGTIGRANLRDSGFALLLSGGSFSVRSEESGLALYTRLTGHGLSYNRVRISEAEAVLNAHNVDWRGANTSFSSASATLRADAINGRKFSAAGADAHLDLGQWSGEQQTGPAHVTVELTQLKTTDVRADKTVLRAASQTLKLETGAPHLRLSGPIDASTEITAAHYRLKKADLLIPSLTANAKGDAALSDSVTGSLTASVKADLAMSPADARRFARDLPLVGDDAKMVRAIAAAFHGTKLEAANVYIGKSSKPLFVSLPEPVTLASRSGARAMIAQSGDILLSIADGRTAGGFTLALSGGGLPNANLSVAKFTAREKPDGTVLDSTLSLSAKASLGSLHNAALVTNGKLASEHGRTVYTPVACVKLALGGYVSRGKTSLSDLRTELCPPSQQPLLISTAAGWSLTGTWRNLTAKLDAGDAHAISRNGQLRIAGNDNGFSTGLVTAANVRLTDAKSSPRFAPLLASARLALANSQWRGDIGVVIAKTKRKLATVTLHHDLQSDSGEALIVSDLSFAPETFQPGEVSPLLAALSQVKGAATFRGRLAWNADGSSSGGTFVLRDADFVGPLGTVRHGATEIVFTSLTPLATASAQQLTAQKIEWLVPFSDLVLRFQLDEEAFRLERFEAAAVGGHVELAPMTVALNSKATTSGTLKLDNVNLSALIAASNLSDKVSLNTPVTGSIPFRYGPAGLRVTDGYFASTGPSRLSIKRTVWTGGTVPAQTDAISDFAYQALENLAIDELDAKLNSLPKGRLGVVFHIKGRNDPALAQDIRISAIDLLQGHAFDKPLPLPKGTPVDLTLDTSLNFDELLDAYRKAFSADLAEAAATSKEEDEGMTP